MFQIFVMPIIFVRDFIHSCILTLHWPLFWWNWFLKNKLLTRNVDTSFQWWTVWLTICIHICKYILKKYLSKTIMMKPSKSIRYKWDECMKMIWFRSTKKPFGNISNEIHFKTIGTQKITKEFKLRNDFVIH